MSSTNNDFCVNCPTDCLSDPPVIACDDCVVAFEYGQVEMIYWTNIGNPLADTADFALRVDNSATADPAAIRALCVKGQVNAPDQDEKEFACDVIQVVNRTYNIEADVDRLNDTNYDALRQMQCSPRWLFWYTMRGQNYLYGGLSGIAGNFITNFESEGNGKSDILLGKFSIKWDGLCAPERITHPSPGIGCN